MISADDARRLKLSDQMIRKYGAQAILRRSTGDRVCWACIVQYTTSEKQGRMINPTDRRALVSAVGLDPPPSSEVDSLVTLDPETGAEKETLRIIAPIDRVAPAQSVLYWDLQVRR